MIIIINGAPGSGKTETAKYLFETTDKSAIIDGDWLLAINPFERNNAKQMRLRYQNIANVAKNYYNAGFTNIFISFVYPKQSNLTEQIDLLKNIDSVKVFALIPTSQTLQKRHSEDSYKREDIESSIELNKQIASLQGIDRIDNSIISIEEVANQINKLISN